MHEVYTKNISKFLPKIAESDPKQISCSLGSFGFKFKFYKDRLIFNTKDISKQSTILQSTIDNNIPKFTIKALLDTNYQNALESVFQRKEDLKFFYQYLTKLNKIDYDRFWRLTQCNRGTLVLSCANGHYKLVKSKCNLRECPFCSKSKIRIVRSELKDFIINNEERLPLRMMSLSHKNTKILDTSIKIKYNNNLKLLKTRLKRYGYTFVKGIKCIEIPYHKEGDARYFKDVKVGVYDSNNAGYHYHLHLLYYGRYECKKGKEKFKQFFSKDGFIDADFLRQEWENITKDSFNVNLQKINYGVKAGVNYIASYFGMYDSLYILESDYEQTKKFMFRLRMFEKFGFKDSFKRYKLKCYCPLCKERMRIGAEGLLVIENKVDIPLFMLSEYRIKDNPQWTEVKQW